MKRIISVFLAVVLAVGLLIPAVASDLPDISGHWAEAEIKEAVAEGWVNGYPDGTFRPEGTITRAEFVKMLLSATHLTPGSDTVKWLKASAKEVRKSRFESIKPYTPTLADMSGHWLTKQGWTDAALYSGLVIPSDYSDKKFKPENKITRYEIAVMATRSLGLVWPAQQPLTEELSFTDKDAIADWVKGYVDQATKAGVLQGYPDGSFGPKKTATRAEAVVMVSRVLDYMEEGLNPEVNIVLHCVVDHEPVDQKLEDIPAQRIDDFLYVSVADVFSAWDRILYPDPSDYGIGAHYFPVSQDFDFFDSSYIYMFRSGYVHCIDGSYVEYELSDDSRTLIAPPRLLYGKLMAPIYDYKDVELQDRFHHAWTGWFDSKTNTATIGLSLSYHPSS